ncbi:MAG TPA: YlbF family regulator [Methylomirabilota bacterium]|nr:YlbF family regulator [Methylomirabilota bacterium]
MQTLTETDVIAQKTRELCQAIVDQPDFQDVRKRVDAFLADEAAQAQYESLSEKGQFLQHKQQNGLPLTSEEITAFEQQRETLMNNPVAKGFLDAQEQMQTIHSSVNQYVTKTLELGRVPGEEDFKGGGCGSGCGCHH